MKPPDVASDRWNDLDVITQANLIAYHHVREQEELKEKIEFAKATMRPVL